MDVSLGSPGADRGHEGEQEGGFGRQDKENPGERRSRAVGLRHADMLGAAKVQLLLAEMTREGTVKKNQR